MSVLFFGLVAVTPNPRLTFIHINYRPSPGEAPLAPEAQRRYEDEASLKASQAIAHDFPRAMFVLMPIFGLLTWALYGKARRFYAAHLYYSLHFHAFVFLALAFELVLILALQGRLRAVYWLAPTAAAVYLCVSLRRVFGGGFLQTAWKARLLWFVYVFLIIATMVGVGLVSVRGDVPGASTAPGITAH